MDDRLEGRLARVLWRSDRGSFAVIRLVTPTGPVMAVGPLSALPDLEEGEPGPFVSLEGSWEQDRVHGRQFKATSYLVGNPRTSEGLVLYLSGLGVKGLGKGRAKRIVQTLGDEALTAIGDPEKVAAIKGISEAVAQELALAWQSGEEERNVSVLLRSLGLHPTVVERIRSHYGERVTAIVTGEPYRLAEEVFGVGFRTSDELARKLGMQPDDPGRVRAAVVHVLRQARLDGQCFLTEAQLTQGVRELGVPVEGLGAALGEGERAGRLVREPDGAEGLRIYPASLYRQEVEVAEQAVFRGQQNHPDAASEAEVRAAAEAVGVDLDPGQIAAVRQAASQGLTVITGGPGTGKTTLLRVLVELVRRRGEIWHLASPTGRAAKRIEEATGASASTVHRLLGYTPQDGFTKGLDEPLEGEGLVVDEASMVDLPLMSAILRATPAEDEAGRPFRVVLVGDADQLPSVGPGQVLRDLVRAGTVPVCRLSTVYRQRQESGIRIAAREVHAGRVPGSGEKRGYDDFFRLHRPTAEAAARTLVHIATERLADRFDVREEVQVLAPTRRGELGVERLNQALQQQLNPLGQQVGKTSLRVGDRVMCTKNTYDLEVFNGDVGRAVGLKGADLVVDFDGRRVDWPAGLLHQLELAYAITVHKSQGSEYPAVVLALHRSHGLMLQRNLVYTALTRAKRFCCVVGEDRAWERAVATPGVDVRQTALAERLTKAE